MALFHVLWAVHTSEPQCNTNVLVSLKVWVLPIVSVARKIQEACWAWKGALDMSWHCAPYRWRCCRVVVKGRRRFSWHPRLVCFHFYAANLWWLKALVVVWWYLQVPGQNHVCLVWVLEGLRWLPWGWWLVMVCVVVSISPCHCYERMPCLSSDVWAWHHH